MTKKTVKKIPLLTPENYIRKKSRNLSISECWTSDNWRDSGITNIVIVREHASGNISACMYLVDLFCLGVKDTTFFYNISPYEFEDNYLNKMRDSYQLEKIPYDLAHNIIYAAIEFAEEYGFKPHKEFTNTTRFFLEEDDENIPLIVVECGKDGIPAYINTGYESEKRETQIYNQLLKTAGEGNFYFYNSVQDEDDDFDYKDESSYVDQETKLLEALSFEEKKDLYLELANKDDNTLVDDDLSKAIILTNLLMIDLIDKDKYNNIFNELEEDLKFDDIVEYQDIPNSLFEGLSKGKSEVVELYEEFNDYEEGSEELKSVVKQIKDTAGEIALSAYCELSLLDREKKSYDKQLDKCLIAFPEYPMFKIDKITRTSERTEDKDNFLYLLRELKQVFDGRERITEDEYDYFLTTYIVISLMSKGEDLDLETVAALSNYLEFEQPDSEKKFTLLLILESYKRKFIIEILENH